MKKLLFFTLLSLSLSHLQLFSKVCRSKSNPSIFYDDQIFPEGVLNNAPDAPEKMDIIVAFDLNDVVFSADYARGLREIKNMCQKVGFVSSVQGFAKASKILLYKLYLNLTKHPRARAWDGYFELLIEQGKTPKDKEHIRAARKLIQAINNINMEVVELIQELQQQNYTTPALTNMGVDFIKDQSEILHNQHSNALLTAYHKQILTTVLELIAHPGSTMPCAEINWAVKPQPEIYTEFLRKNNPSQTKIIVFVDDKERNVKAAVTHGIPVAIVFSSCKRLKKDLIHLGVLGTDLPQKSVSHI